jgi:SAM-dependent methyltransferase
MNMDNDVHCICGSRMSDLPFSKNFYRLKCSRCASSRFVNASSQANDFDYNASNDKYSETSYLFGAEFRWSHRTIAEHVQSCVSKGARILEVGCFNGFFVKTLRDLGYNANGVDLNQSALAVGKTQHGLDGFLYDNMTDALSEGEFDAIICIDVVEHLDDPNAFLNLLKKSLKPHGVIIVAGPVAERRFHDKSDFPPHHRWWFTIDGLKALGERNGLGMRTIETEFDLKLLVRNIVGRVVHGFGEKEFYGNTVSAVKRKQNSVVDRLNGSISRLLHKCGFIYCSAILILEVKT